MEGIRCPDCKSDQIGKYGKTKAGLQKWRCLVPSCRRQFVAGSDHQVSPETKAVVMGLLRQKVHPKKIHGAVEGISLRWIYQLRRRINGR